MVPLTESCCWSLPLVTERLPGWSFPVFAQLTSLAQSQKRDEREKERKPKRQRERERESRQVKRLRAHSLQG